MTPPAVSVKMPVVRATSLMPSTSSSSAADSIVPPVERATPSANTPSAGLPMASDFASPCGRTGTTWSAAAANAVATGAQPSPCAAVHDRVRPGLDQPGRPALAEALQDLRVEGARRDRRDDPVGRAPAQVLGGLERDRLRPLRVVGPHVHVHERPRALEGQLRAQPVHVVVGAVHRKDGRAVGGRGDDLLALQVRRHEDVGRQAERRGGGRGGAGKVARRRAGERLVAELDRLGGRDRHDPILERMRRVRRLGLDVEVAVEAELDRQPVGPDERRAPDRQAARRAAPRAGSRRTARAWAARPRRPHGRWRRRRRRSRPRAGRSTGRRRTTPRAGRRLNSLCRRVGRPS